MAGCCPSSNSAVPEFLPLHLLQARFDQPLSLQRAAPRSTPCSGCSRRDVSDRTLPAPGCCRLACHDVGIACARRCRQIAAAPTSQRAVGARTICKPYAISTVLSADCVFINAQTSTLRWPTGEVFRNRCQFFRRQVNAVAWNGLETRQSQGKP